MRYRVIRDGFQMFHYVFSPFQRNIHNCVMCSLYKRYDAPLLLAEAHR